MLTLNDKFVFKPFELTTKLSELSEDKPVGYWQLELKYDGNSPQYWYLAIFQNQVFFSGSEPLSWQSFFEILNRYIHRLRSNELREQIHQFKLESMDKQNNSLRMMTNQMVLKGLLKFEEVVNALKLQIVTDLDTYLFEYGGQARFIPEAELLRSRPIPGFELTHLLKEVAQRREEWNKLKKYIPNLDAIMEIDLIAFKNANLTDTQKNQIKQLISQGLSLRNISLNLGKDPLNLARTFSNLIQNNLIKIKLPHSQNPRDSINVFSSNPRVFIVDDSPVILNTFKRLVTALGYEVECCENPLKAIEAISVSHPEVIFLDINMPGITGFQLIKKIRQQPHLASVPLVMLTAEKSSTNKLRAEWSKTKFLAKPLNQKELSTFHNQLKSLLEELIPIKN